MEDNKCILLKIGEYEDLLYKANADKSNEVKIIISLDKGRLYGVSTEYTINYKGNIELSDNIQKQIRNITHIINDNLDSKIREFTQKGKNLAIEDFTNLPWYKRLFFDKKYIK